MVVMLWCTEPGVGAPMSFQSWIAVANSEKGFGPDMGNKIQGMGASCGVQPTIREASLQEWDPNPLL